MSKRSVSDGAGLYCRLDVSAATLTVTVQPEGSGGSSSTSSPTRQWGAGNWSCGWAVGMFQCGCRWRRPASTRWMWR
jgi:hypothetical protein